MDDLPFDGRDKKKAWPIPYLESDQAYLYHLNLFRDESLIF